MSFVIVVTPADPEFRDAPGLEDLPVHLRADLEEFRDEVCERFPEADAVGQTGGLCARPTIEGVGVVIRPEVITRPLVVNAVMRFAAPRQLLVTSPELGLEADPRCRVGIDVHRRPTVTGAGITDHAMLGRPYGTLPWITRDLLLGLVGKLEFDGDRLEMEVDIDRWFRYELLDGALEVSVCDGPDCELLRLTLDQTDATLAADAGWAWARCADDWAEFLIRSSRAAASEASSAGPTNGEVAAA